MLRGKRALVTGASKGIGRAIALAREGAEVAFTYYRDRNGARATADTIRSYSSSPLVFQTDLADRDATKALFEQVEAKWAAAR